MRPRLGRERAVRHSGVMVVSRLALLPLILLAACGESTAPAPAPSPSASPSPAVAADATEAMRAYAAVNDRMHTAMGTIDRDPDVAFMQGMIPHHRGAVEMAEIVLQHGKDPETRALAQRIIAAQREEIAEMEAWLAKRGQAAAAPADAGGAHHGH